MKLSNVNLAGIFMTVERARVSKGRPTLRMKTAAAKPVAGRRILPRRLCRFIDPFEPIVTKRRASRTRRASIISVMMPMSMIEAATTPATPVWREAMLRNSDVERTSNLTGSPRT
ncbi:hypothetical protein D3C80_1317970 [compost metagenome]